PVPHCLSTPHEERAEVHRGDQSQSRASPNHQQQTRQETSLTVFRTDNKSWSSCGAERTQPSEAHRRYPATRIAEPSRKPLPLASPDHLRKSMVAAPRHIAHSVAAADIVVVHWTFSFRRFATLAS